MERERCPSVCRNGNLKKVFLTEALILETSAGLITGREVPNVSETDFVQVLSSNSRTVVAEWTSVSAASSAPPAPCGNLCRDTGN